MEGSGDTKWKGRNFLLTLNDISLYSELRDYLFHFGTFQYAIACREVAPTTGHKHIHIFCQYNNAITLKKSKLCGAHVDKCKGSAQENIKYIKKIDKPDEKGEIIWEEGTPLYKGRMSISDVESMTREERKNLPLIYYKTIEKINMLENMHADIEKMFKEVKVRYIFGKSGLGKTYLASQWLKELNANKFDIVSFENGFWNGVTDECPYAFYDDFRDTDMPPVMFIKFIDYTIKNLNIKGGFVKNNYRFIFITSIKDPRNIYGHAWEERKQWLRRMEIYEFTAYNVYHQINIQNYDDY